MSSVSISQYGSLGELVLNKPGTLNALTFEDIESLHTGLAQHTANPDVRAIVIRSDSERAFCAGGDVKSVRTLALDGQFDVIDAFFAREYALNLAIAQCNKPYIAFMRGITMGGGLGISAHGQFRIVTETSVLAMPESRIGFFPDVGATWFLPRLAMRAGYWMGLTADAVHGSEALRVGLATHAIVGSELMTLRETLRTQLDALPSGVSTQQCTDCIQQVLDAAPQLPLASESFEQRLDDRSGWFADDELSAIRERLKAAARSGSQDAKALLQALDSGSPHSAQMTVELWRSGAEKTIDQCLELEKAMVGQAVRHPDFAEGIRAVLVDKDKKPQWQGKSRTA